LSEVSDSLIEERRTDQTVTKGQNRISSDQAMGRKADIIHKGFAGMTPFKR